MTTDALSEKPLALIIEDDRQQATIFEQALRMADFETEVIRDGKSALERLAAIVPTLVVLDLGLPYVSGEDVLHQMRADERLAKTPIILATANPLAAEPLQEKSDLVLLKPISLKQLRDLAARLRSADGNQ